MSDGIAPIKCSRPKPVDSAANVPNEAGNVWFVGPEPMKWPWRLASATLLLVSAISMVMLLSAVWGWLTTQLG